MNPFPIRLRIGPPANLKEKWHGKRVKKWYVHRFGYVPADWREFPCIPLKALKESTRKRILNDAYKGNP